MLELSTERLRLRRFSTCDLAACEHLLMDEEVMASSDDGSLSLEEVAAWLAERIEEYDRGDGVEVLAVETKSDRQVVGYCGLWRFDDIGGSPEIEIGYRLVPDVWGIGYATEAAGAVRDYAFEVLGLKRLVALIEPVNKRSIRVASKLGMHYEKDVMMEGYDYPDHLYVLEADV